MEGYRLTTRGKIALFFCVTLLAYGLFMIGTQFSKSFGKVVDQQINPTTEVATQTEATEAATQTESTESATANTETEAPLDTTLGVVDNCNVDHLATQSTTEMPIAEDLVKVATIVYFKPDHYSLDDQAKKELKPFIETALNFKDMPIVIEGHSGSINQVTADDEGLAKKRAEAIRTYLLTQGIAPNRILITSLAGTLDGTQKQQDIWKTMRAEIYFQGYSMDK